MFKRGRYLEKSYVQIITDSKPLDPLNTINTIQSTYRTLYLHIVCIYV